MKWSKKFLIYAEISYVICRDIRNILYIEDYIACVRILVIILVITSLGYNHSYNYHSAFL